MSDVSGTDAQPEAAVEAEPTEAVAPDPHALDASHAGARRRGSSSELGDAVLDRADVFGMPVVRVRRIDWRAAAEVAKGALDCDYLSFVVGHRLDAGAEGGWRRRRQRHVVAGAADRDHLRRRRLRGPLPGVRARAVDPSPLGRHVQGRRRRASRCSCESWVPVYPGADWHERECWEMYGFVFDGHPALRHLYLPSEFEGHPLRKDYPLLSRVVKPWPGLVDVEPMPGDGDDADGDAAAAPRRRAA